MDNISTLNSILKKAYNEVMMADESSPLIKNACPSSQIVYSIINYSRSLVVKKSKNHGVVKFVEN
ncbi:MAG: hypothetical protein U9R32_06305 [Bacteroidota bacterium]|nr:hypothetical protein [Bacteroidota bacterium]